ncbi:hypothetical protein PROFUN_14650 [Planoprotostelium fungivorum]|uniref:Fatty acid hydroxylase domain-containing protein n=1 Tax=Planoprotostelium fungivorum TaxID=1890364 RepID=A0A2P6MMQ9_9EUKA|nr:hypothetical protein PROFUN_14650 [Planoprotostelium fungivorum]
MDQAMLNVTTNHFSMSPLEGTWLWFYSLHSNPALVTAVVCFALHELIWFGGWLFSALLDYVPSVQKYKLQSEKVLTSEQWWKCTWGCLLSHFFIQLPMMLGFHPAAEFVGVKILEVPFPPWWKVILQITACAIFEDTYYYWFHRALHWGPLYAHIHKQHHEFSAPRFGSTAEYAHPLETLILGMGTIGGPLLIAVTTQDIHMFTVMCWMIFRMLQSLESHCGYELPYGFKTVIPFWSGADHHDYHHQAFTNCYATSFRWWDSLMGTDMRYHAFRQRQHKEKASKQK